MLAVLLEQDHRQQARTGPAARDHMEGRRRLANLLAVAAGEFLAHMLDHLPLSRDHFQRLGDILAQLAQSRAAATLAGCWSRLDHPLARQMLGERLARRPLADERHHIRRLRRGAFGGELVFGRRTLEFFEASIPSGRAAAPSVRNAGRTALASAWRSATAGARSRPDRRRLWPWPPPVRLSTCSALSFAASSAAFSVSISSGRSLLAAAMPGSNHKSRPLTRTNCERLPSALRAECMPRVPPVDAVKHVGELRRRDGNRPVRR